MRSLKTTLMMTIAGSAMVAAASPAFAQINDDDVIVVTGSKLSSANVVSTSPVTTLDSASFTRQGTIDAVDLLNTLPSVTPSQDSAVSNGATGTSSINLRGLGSNRNLILVDGKRLAPGRPDIASSDLNQVPTPLLERVEVVTGGASAVYGSDAIAGVVNFVLDRDFEGLELDGNFSFFMDRNSDDFIQEVTDLSSTDGVTPAGTQYDGETFDISAKFGTGFADGRGNMVAYVRYVDQGEVLQGTRDISRCAIVDFGPVAGTDVTCVGSNFGPNPTTLALPVIFETDGAGDNVQFLIDTDGAFVNAAGTVVTRANAVLAPAGTPAGGSGPRQLLGSAAGTVSLDASGNFTLGADGQGAGSTNAFNFNPTNFFQRPTERIQGGFLASYEIADNLEAYVDAFFFRNVTDAQIAPSGTFGEVTEVNCDNPFLSAAQRQTICTDRGFAATDNATVQINRRFVEGGGRNTKVELDNLRVVTGLRGAINDSSWTWDAFLSYNVTSNTATDTNDAQIDLLQDSLLVVNDAAGNPVCQSGNAGCLPLNFFETGPVDATALASVLTPTITSGEGTQLIIGGTIQGEFESFKSPYAESGLALLGGIEYREDTLNSQPDAILAAGNATGLGGPALPTAGTSAVTEFFAEAAMPLVQGMPFAEELGITAQYRYSDYDYVNNLAGGAQSDGNSTDAYSLGVSWMPVSDLRLRGQYQRAVRAPNIFELFDPAGLQLFNDSDPCSGTRGSANLTATAAQCALTGLPTALYGFVPEDAGQLQQLAGGNVGLDPETSDTITFGAVVQPSAVPGLIASVDFFDITVDDFITNIPSTAILDGCLDGSTPALCSFINRDALGTIQIDGSITANLQNVANRTVQGLDFNVSYGTSFADMGLPDFGDLSLRYVSTLYTKLEQTNFEGAPITDCLGQWGGDCNTFTGEVNPEYKHTATLGFSPSDAWNFDLTWRYIGAVDSFDDEVPVGGFGNTFGDENFFDLFGTWEAREGVQFRAGINNLFDNDPPISDFRFTANGNTFPSTYDAAGRFVFMGVNLKL